jgi:hypothetical protein
MFVHPGCTNSGLKRPGGDLPKAFVCQRVHGSCHQFAIARALPSSTMFAFYSLNVKLLNKCGLSENVNCVGQSNPSTHPLLRNLTQNSRPKLHEQRETT